MDPVLLHLLFIVAGVVVALSGLWYFARIRGGWTSTGGLATLAILAVGAALVLVGFGLLPLPGMVSA